MVDFFSALSGNVRGLRNKLPVFLRQLSIRNRLFILFITQILFSIIWCGYIVFISFQNEISTVSASNSRVINTITLNLQNEMNTLASITKYPVLQTPNRTLIYNYLSNPQNSSTFRYELYTTVQADCNQLFELYPNIRNIVFYMLLQQLYYLCAGTFTFRAKWNYRVTVAHTISYMHMVCNIVFFTCYTSKI